MEVIQRLLEMRIVASVTRQTVRNRKVIMLLSQTLLSKSARVNQISTSLRRKTKYDDFI